MHEKESMSDQEALGESISTNKASRRVDKPLDNAQEVKEPTIECSSKERSSKTTLEDNSPLISLISTFKNPQTVNVATHIESGDSQSKQLDISKNTFSSQEKSIREEVKTETTIMVKQALSKANLDMHFNDSKNNIEISATKALSSEIYDKARSSTHSKLEMHEMESMDDQEAPRENICTKDASGIVDKPLDDSEEVKDPTIECSSEERSDKTIIKEKSALITLISGSEIPHTESGGSQSEQSDIRKNTYSPQGQNMVNETEPYINEQIKVDHVNPQLYEEDDLIRLFRIIEEGAEMEFGMPSASKIAALEGDNKVVKAFADLETSLNMALNEIASSEDNILRLENALSFLSSHCSEDADPSHSLKATIDSLHQEIQSVVSSFKQASSTIHTFTELEERERSINLERSQRKEAAITLVSKIFDTEKSMTKAQQKEVELKEHISKLQVEQSNIEREIKDCEIKLSSLQEQKNNSVSDTIRFFSEFEAVKRDKFQMVEEQTKARQVLENVDAKWSSCVANLRKTIQLSGIYLKQKL